MISIYLDHNATTPLAPEALEVMLPMLGERFGNPSSIHAHGRAARVRLDEAREQVAGLIRARPGEIIFTSGGTEADNLAIKGLAWTLATADKKNHIITCQVEHPAVLNSCRDLERHGFKVDFLPVDGFGRVDPDLLERTINERTILITIQHANHEVGTLQEIGKIGVIARNRGVWFHTDAVQSAGKVPLDMRDLPVDFLSMSAHKLNGPKGVGALYARKGTPALVPVLSGGGQEKGRRGGTENVAGIVGFGKAADLLRQRFAANGMAVLEAMRERLARGIEESVPGVHWNGHPRLRLPNTLNASFPGVVGETLLIALDVEGISVSTGSACGSGSVLPSPVLTAMRVPSERINASLRLSLGWSNTPEEIDTAAATIARLVRQIRAATGAAATSAPQS